MPAMQASRPTARTRAGFRGVACHAVTLHPHSSHASVAADQPLPAALEVAPPHQAWKSPRPESRAQTLAEIAWRSAEDSTRSYPLTRFTWTIRDGNELRSRPGEARFSDDNPHPPTGIELFVGGEPGSTPR